MQKVVFPTIFGQAAPSFRKHFRRKEYESLIVRGTSLFVSVRNGPYTAGRARVHPQPGLLCLADAAIDMFYFS